LNGHTPQYPPRSGERIYLMCCHVHDNMPKERTSSSRAVAVHGFAKVEGVKKDESIQ